MRRVVIPGVVAAVAVAGCGTVRIADNARVAGVVKLYGGPAPGKCFTEPVRIAVRGNERQVVARSHPANGRFAFDLVPGTYTVSASASGYVIGTVSVDAVAGKTTHVTITNGNVS